MGDPRQDRGHVEVRRVIEGIQAYLSYLQAMGLEGVPGYKEKGPTLEDIRREMGDCKRCRLHKSRRNIVFGSGNPRAILVFVGEGPGREEDMQGLPFVGAAGEMLTRIIERVLNMERKDVYIANVVKCRPPNNRTPRPDEIAACLPFLERQLEVIGPKVIVALGSVAAQSLIGTKEGITALRGRFHYYRGDTVVMPTYHPAYLLRNPGRKKETYQDMLMVKERLEGLAGGRM